jgi:hypothetical protein
MWESRTGTDREALWDRHESPVSVRWLVLMYPVFVLAIYRRSRPLGGVLVVSLAANLFVVSPPETDDAWTTRVVRGEREWLDRGLLSSESDLLVIAVGGLLNAYTLRAAYHRRPSETMVGTLASVILMFLFFHRMAALYGTTRGSRDEPETSP